MKTQLTDQVKFLQKAAIIHEGKVLILKRSDQSASRPRAWDLPGGNAEWPTTTEKVIHLHRAEVSREILEETGIQLDPQYFNNDALIYFLTFFEPDVQRYSIGCGWRIELSADFDPSSVKLSDEHTDQAWISLDQLDSYDFGEPVGTYIKEIIRRAYQRK
jgi:8-oxo-dGTP pyrophosphatase MutT (NUDIX family)